jgi:hypothetical protein
MVSSQIHFIRLLLFSPIGPREPLPRRKNRQASFSLVGQPASSQVRPIVNMVSIKLPFHRCPNNFEGSASLTYQNLIDRPSLLVGTCIDLENDTLWNV